MSFRMGIMLFTQTRPYTRNAMPKMLRKRREFFWARAPISFRLTAAATLLLVMVGLASPARAALERVSDFALLDTRGEFHQLSRYKHRKALALLTYDSRCSRPAQLAEFARLQSSIHDHIFFD